MSVDQLQQVESWRQQQLHDAGFPPLLAAQAACNSAFDVHALIELVERGCPAELAMRILAPT
jgi:hypothetical protein